MIRRPPRSTLDRSSAASDVYKRQIQGSTDIPTLFNLLPGYLPMPHAAHGPSLERYLHGHRTESGWWCEMPKYMCLLYTSDAADERSSVDLGGRRIIKKKKRNYH